MFSLKKPRPNSTVTPDRRSPRDGEPLRVSVLIAVLLAGAWASADAALALLIRSRGSDWPALPAVFGVGVVFGQVSLMASWLVWGRSSLALRMGGSAIGLFGLGSLAASCTGDDWSVWLAALLMCLAGAAPFFLLLRVSGCVLVRAADDSSEALAGLRRAGQFSIWGLLSLMTGLAILLATLRLVELPWDAPVGMALFLAGVSGNAWLSFYLAFRCRNALFRWLVTGAGACLMGGLLRFTGIPPHDDAELILMSLIQAAAVSGSVSVLQVAGWKLAAPGARECLSSDRRFSDRDRRLKPESAAWRAVRPVRGGDAL